MSAPRLPIPVELPRIRHTRCEQLRSADLRDALAVQAQLRWWHNRGSHASLGIAWGLSVTPGTSPAGAPLVRVSAGVAYDCYGRELHVHAPRTIELLASSPDVRAATLLLGPAEPEPRSGPPSGDEVTLWWEPGTHPDLRVGVPLVRARLGEGPAWAFEPPQFGTRPAARPRVGRGTTTRGGTNWQPWTANGGDLFLGVETVVDTTPAGFTGTPRYFSEVVGPTIPGPLADALSKVEGVSLLVPLLHLTDPRPAGFRARILLPLGFLSAGSRNAIRLMYKRDVALCWLGIEPHATSRCAEGSS